MTFIHPLTPRQRIDFLPQFCDHPEGSGGDLMKRALQADETAHVIGAWWAQELVGAASYRFTDCGVKRICTGVLYERQLIGSDLVSWICFATKGLPQWCKSVPQANVWCGKMGMTAEAEFPPCEGMPDGATVFRWAATEAWEFHIKNEY